MHTLIHLKHFMASKFLFMYTLLLTFSLCFHGISSAGDGIKYNVINNVPKTPGGIRFEKDIGTPYTKEILPKITNFIWTTMFQQNNPADRKPLDTIEVFIGHVGNDAAGVTVGNKITVDSATIGDHKGDVKWYFTSILYHEATHVLQWFGGKDTCPVSLIEGIADYTHIKAKFLEPGYLKPGEGDKWDQGYACTARFIEYCDGLVPGFVAKLNKKLKTTCNLSVFKELTGKPVDQLWKEYKAKYGKKN